MIDILPKKYRLTLSISEEKEFVIFHSTATFAETLSLQSALSSGSEQAEEYMKEFVVSHGIDESVYKNMREKEKHSLLDHLMHKYCKGYFAKKGDKKVDNVDEAPMSSLVCFVLKYSNETLESLLKLTWSQISFLLEGIIWNLNEKTKKGKEKNRADMRRKAFESEYTNDEALEAVRVLEEKLKRDKELLQNKDLINP